MDEIINEIESQYEDNINSGKYPVLEIEEVVNLILDNERLSKFFKKVNKLFYEGFKNQLKL